MVLLHGFLARTATEAADLIRINSLQPLMHLADASLFRPERDLGLVVEVWIEAAHRAEDLVGHAHGLFELLLALGLKHVQLV